MLILFGFDRNLFSQPIITESQAKENPEWKLRQIELIGDGVVADGENKSSERANDDDRDETGDRIFHEDTPFC